MWVRPDPMPTPNANFDQRLVDALGRHGQLRIAEIEVVGRPPGHVAEAGLEHGALEIDHAGRPPPT
jgi:hypothetical protein